MQQQPTISEFYPNPSITGQVNLTYFSQQDTPINIQMFNSKGQLVSRERRMLQVGDNTLSFDFSEIGIGLFFIKIGQQEQVEFRKLVIE